MAYATQYEPEEPTRAAIDALPGAVLLEFGTTTCGYCRMAQPLVARALESHPGVRHIKVSDGSGQPLGRSFGVKLWPTFVFLRDGREASRLVRAARPQEFADALAAIDP